ncbi:BTB/POZ domain-containing protein SR1IP1 [Bienertia sinuspersici]
MSSKKKELLSSAMKRTSEWISSQEVPSDVNIHIGDASFSLHKFPLSSKCGYLKKLISESNDSDVCNVEIHDIPGGSEAFELAAKFCYGFNFELSTENIAMLRCVAEYLEMTEDYAVGNLVGRTESYLNEVALKSLSSCVSILVTSENLLPMAEQVKLVSRCVDAIAILACKDSQFSGSNKIEGESEGGNSSLGPQQKAIAEFWWAEDLTMLRIDMFHRVMIAMTARGFKQYALGPLLMLYAQKSLRGYDLVKQEMISKGRKKLEPKQEHEKRVVLETIVSLLPRERNVLSVSFLAMLLRSSTWLETTVACRLDLEKRMALQLGQAALDDLLIPSYCITGDTLFDVDSVRRILMNYLESEVEGNHLGYGVGEEHVSPSNDLERVGKLMENYLAEIASDRNLTVSKFIGLVELIPEQARVTDDGIYRAIDIFLKAHPTLSDLERKKVCSVMDCQKLSREACAHAAQNDRLPVQTVVQVLYHEQQRLRDNMNETNGGESNSSTGAIVPSKTLNLYPTSTPSTEELLKLRRENEDLKIELLKLNMRLKEVDKRMNLIDNANNYNNNININTSTSATNSPANSFAPSVTAGAADGDQKPPLPRKSFMNSVKKLGRLLLLADGVLTPSTRRTKSNKGRRHSIS